MPSGDPAPIRPALMLRPFWKSVGVHLLLAGYLAAGFDVPIPVLHESDLESLNSACGANDRCCCPEELESAGRCCCEGPVTGSSSHGANQNRESCCAPRKSAEDHQPESESSLSSCRCGFGSLMGLTGCDAPRIPARGPMICQIPRTERFLAAMPRNSCHSADPPDTPPPRHS